MKTMQYCLSCQARTVFTNDKNFIWHCAECGIAEGVEPLLELRSQERHMSGEQKRTEWIIRKAFRVAMVLLFMVTIAAAQQTAPVEFDRTCVDPEDGDVSASMVWTSDLDGEVGLGGVFVADLSEGLHTITVTCEDSQGDSPTPLVITHTVAVANLLPAFGDAAGGGPGLPVDGGCTGSDCP